MATGSRQERQQFPRPDEPVLNLASCGSGPDPRLVKLVRLLARRAARKAYVEMLEERRTTRS
ncbi:hypothetical protein [Sphingobium sp. KCTC 72723]|uniref:hypothetical protein n=1 Tax=Sphingobium sp. KCTC 72723 TaxID=2733867 RepID=UPI00165E5D7F|nr:hypothetical protein [Sphingobium sp. KCTC 72723]